MSVRTALPESAAIQMVSINSRTHPANDVKVRFVSGRTYIYRGVPREVIRELDAVRNTGGSVGAFVNARIKGHYPYREQLAHAH